MNRGRLTVLALVGLVVFATSDAIAAPEQAPLAFGTAAARTVGAIIDPDCDASLDIGDAVHVRRVVAGVAEAAPGCSPDANGSGGATDTDDALFVMRALAGLVPLVASITPTQATAGGAGFTLDVYGTGFADGAEILWDGTALETDVLDPGHATASVATTNLAFDGGSRVALRLASGAVSNAVVFDIAPGVDSYALIDAALLAGDITAEEALTFKLNTDFSDERLPEAYRSGAKRTEGTARWDLVEQFASLSPQAQEGLAPYLLPPDDPGSWFYLRHLPPDASPLTRVPGCNNRPLPPGGWHVVDGPHVTVKWHDCFPADAAKAANIQLAVNTTIWDRLTALLGEPLPDSRPPSTRSDIYLVGPAQSHSMPYNVCPAAGWMELGSDDPHWYSDYTVAHELAHLMQYRYSYPSHCLAQEHRWLIESTAKWVEDYLYPSPGHPPYTDPAFRTNPEHHSAQDLLLAPSLPLNVPGYPRVYGSYLWWFFLHRWNGPAGAQLVRTTFDALGTSPDSAWAMRAAVNGMAGGLRDLWPRFAFANWNRFEEGTADFYQTWDGLTDSVVSVSDQQVTLGSNDFAIYTLDAPVRELSARYYEFTFADDVGTITITNPNWSDHDAHLQGFWQLKGSDAWKPARNATEDWGDLQERVFCRDLADEAVERLVIIISSSHIDPGELGGFPEVKAEKRGCSDWAGTASVTYDFSGTTDDYSQEHHQELSANIRLKWLTGELYQVSEQTAQWSSTYSFEDAAGQCTGGGSGDVLYPRPFSGGTHNSVVQFIEDPPDAPYASLLVLTALPTSATRYEVPCSGGGSIMVQGNPGDERGLLNFPVNDTTGLRNPAPPYRMSADRKSFEGSISLTFTTGDFTTEVTWQWNLQREKAP